MGQSTWPLGHRDLGADKISGTNAVALDPQCREI